LNTKEIIEKLKSIGFKEYEAKVFVVLMKGIPMSVSDIAKEANLIRNSIYDTLKSFAERGYCNEIETNTILKYQIINPEIIIGKVEKEFDDLNRKRILTFKDTLTELKDHYKKNTYESEDSIDNVELIRGFNKHRLAKYMELVENAKFEILAMNRLKGLITDDINNFTKKFTKNGGVIRSLYKISLDFKVMKEGKQVNASNEDLVKVCEMFESFGEKVKLTAIEIPNLVIIDREKIFLNITGEKAVAKNKQSDLIINDKNYTCNMIDLFESYWERSASINEYKYSNIKISEN
jgi:sugar-specific transcriptional regulator TrmB